jgi:hypothetical protein
VELGRGECDESVIGDGPHDHSLPGADRRSRSRTSR